MMNYRFNRLLLDNRKRDVDSMLEGHYSLKAMPVTLCDWNFDGHDPVMIFEFHTRLTEEAELNQLSYEQAFATLPLFLSGSTETRCRAARGISREGDIRFCPEAALYLLLTYATPASIRDVVANVCSTNQNQCEDETEYSVRF